MNIGIGPTTPFCTGCGEWIDVLPEMDDSPFYICIACSPKKPIKNEI